MADSEQEMNEWVHDLCAVCNMQREEADPTFIGELLFQGYF